jgi:signal peptide peptidase SppA
MNLKNKILSPYALFVVAFVFFAISYFVGRGTVVSDGFSSSFGLIGTLCSIFAIIWAIIKRIAKKSQKVNSSTQLPEKENKCTKFKLKLSPKAKKVIKWICFFILALTVIFFWGEEIEYALQGESGYEESTNQNDSQDCNVVGIPLQGDLYTYISPADMDKDGNLLVDQSSSENIVQTIQEAEDDSNIKAIILEIDSYGGAPVAAEEVANAMRKSRKPTVALIRGAADSAAYYAASGAQYIFASENSDIGSIGVTWSYVSNYNKNQMEGLTYNQLIAGKYKDMMDPNRPLTQEEENLISRDLKISHENFIKKVAENRNLDIEKVRKLADGSTMLGQMALENGLIDKIGGMDEVKKYLSDKFGTTITVCW